MNNCPSRQCPYGSPPCCEGLQPVTLFSPVCHLSNGQTARQPAPPTPPDLRLFDSGTLRRLYHHPSSRQSQRQLTRCPQALESLNHRAGTSWRRGKSKWLDTRVPEPKHPGRVSAPPPTISTAFPHAEAPILAAAPAAAPISGAEEGRRQGCAP